MDSIFEDISIGKIISFVVFIFYILSSLKGKGKQEDEAEQDPEAQARARKIQEEIRRKILERQQGGPVAPPRREEFVEESPPLAFEREETYAEAPVFTQQEEPEPQWEPEPASFEDAYAEQRRQIEEQLEKAAAIRAKTKQPKHSEGYGTIHRSGSASQIRGGVRSGLSNSASLKSAFVLKEILDTPLALR